MSTAVLTSPTMPKPKQGTQGEPAKPAEMKRVPAKISEDTHNKLRELCLIKLRRPIETVIGEWVTERLAHEDRKLAKSGS